MSRKTWYHHRGLFNFHAFKLRSHTLWPMSVDTGTRNRRLYNTQRAQKPIHGHLTTEKAWSIIRVVSTLSSISTLRLISPCTVSTYHSIWRAFHKKEFASTKLIPSWITYYIWTVPLRNCLKWLPVCRIRNKEWLFSEDRFLPFSIWEVIRQPEMVRSSRYWKFARRTILLARLDFHSSTVDLKSIALCSMCLLITLQ